MIIVFQILDYILKKNYRLRLGSKFVAIKLDMMKAFDRVHWDLLEFILYKFGFPNQFSKLCLTCVKIVSFSVMVHEATSPWFSPGMGLRQSDPLSPSSLYLLCG